jgi:membrane associated rhomboid family serine protease
MASPLVIILIGFVLVVTGVAIPFSMMIGLIESGFFLALVSYLASFIGLIMGIYGSALYSRSKNRD